MEDVGKNVMANMSRSSTACAGFVAGEGKTLTKVRGIHFIRRAYLESLVLVDVADVQALKMLRVVHLPATHNTIISVLSFAWAVVDFSRQGWDSSAVNKALVCVGAHTCLARALAADSCSAAMKVEFYGLQ